MVGVLGGVLGQYNPSIKSCMLSILGRISATHRESGT